MKTRKIAVFILGTAVATLSFFPLAAQKGAHQFFLSLD